MSLVRFRPHYLRIIKHPSGYYDANGDYHEEVSEKSGCIRCRYEPNGRAQAVPIGEGKNSVYSYTVYLDHDCEEIPYGTRLELYDACHDSIGIYSSLGFHRGQLDSKLWV